MTDNFCYSVLKTATLQIIQSAGFESAYREPVETLTDVVGKYIETLGSTVSAYANLSGRSTGTAWDVMNAIGSELEPHVLKTWLDEEGKALTPYWSAQSDPSRILEGIVRGGRPNEEAIEYIYGSSSISEFDTLEIQEDDDSESQDSPSDNKSLLLPDYIPSYFPPFPEINDDAITAEGNLLLQPQESSSMPIPTPTTNAISMTELLPPPVIVKKKKKPIENPFTFIVPFEESDLGASTEDQTIAPLSLAMTSTSRYVGKRKAFDLSNNGSESDPLLSALQTIKKPKYKLGQGLIGKGDQVFQTQTEKQAAPGNNLFNRDIGTFDDIVRNIAPPLIVSKISTPNLYMDMLGTSTPTTPSSSTHNLSQQQQNESSFSVPSSPQNTSSTVTSPSSETPKLTKSSSMLATLANGSTTTINTKKQGTSTKKTAKLPTGVTKVKTPKTPKVPKAPKVPKTSKPSSSKTVDQSNNTPMANNITLMDQLSTTEAQNDIGIAAPVPASMKKAKLPQVETSVLDSMSSLSPSPSLTLVQSPMIPTPTPISLNSLSNTQKKDHLTPEQLQQLKLHKQQQKLQRQQLKQQQQQQQQQQKLKQEQDVSLSAEKKKKVPKLMLNISQPTTSSIQNSNESSPSTPKIRFKVKAPPSVQSPTVAPYDPSPPSLPQAPQAEVIHCLCENPTVDYGTFMIACDNCSVWFHGSCVGIAEDDQVEEWYCRRCRA
ncbi:hypothetical protein K501DRAFT_320915 [Backusella circina FSU 941]|nr:hypothetical protein K501DRAFT_320915 [Backusella circina FSU 941]